MAKTDFKTIQEYHNTFTTDVIERMQAIRTIIHDVVTDVEEVISYQIPCFKYKGYLIYYSAYTKHISLSYPFSKAFLAEFSTDLKGYKISKSSLQIPLDKPLPLEMIKRMVEFRKQENEQKTVPKKMMNVTPEHNNRIEKMIFATVFPHYITKVERKGRTIEELYQVIEWLTGFNKKSVQQLINEKVTFETFFEKANLNPNAEKIKGVICGYRIEEIENELTRKTRYLDKLIDELAKGKTIETILRK